MTEHAPRAEPELSIRLCHACLQLARRDCAEAVQELTSLFADMNALLDADNNAGPDSMTLSELQQKMHQAIKGFQFHDRLDQQLGLVLSALEQAGRLSSEPSHKLADWNRLHDQMRAQSTMTTETQLIDAVLNGMDPEQAVQQVRRQQTDVAGDIDLF